ncbi:MAG: hypothetical protein LUH82_01855 [Clostridiales bacterium]|nr:hypothetical protein [Clostridiales bacterium]
MTLTNEQMVIYVEMLTALNERGKLGYAIARNLRRLRDAATEFIDARAKVFDEYGKDAGDGKKTLSINLYNEKLGDIKDIEHEVDVYQVDEKTFFSGNLTSAQMEALLWMVGA